MTQPRGKQVFIIQIHTCDSGLENFEIFTILPWPSYIFNVGYLAEKHVLTLYVPGWGGGGKGSKREEEDKMLKFEVGY